VSEERPFPPEDRELRLRIGAHARELVRAAAVHDVLSFITLANEVVIETFAGIEIAPDATGVTGPAYLQAYLAYAMRIATAMVREALGEDEAAIEDLLTRVSTALEIGDATL